MYIIGCKTAKREVLYTIKHKNPTTYSPIYNQV